MNPLRRLILELHRRSLWQVLGIYVVGAWMVYQVVLGLYEGLGLPDWVPAVTVLLFVIGLPIVLATAFVQEGMPLGSAPDPTLLPGLEGTRMEEPPSPAPPAPLHGFLTWRRAVLGGVIAFALLGATTGGWMGMRATGVGPVGSLVAKGVLEERDRVILADFTSLSGDSALADLVTEALRIDLLQSTVLRLAETSWLSQALERMEREGERLSQPLALELAQREGVKAVIAGEVGQAGGSYILTATVMTANGDVAAAFRETARDSTELLDAIDQLSAAMRGRVGESLSVVRASPPLEQVTTPSLEALRLFTEAERNNGPMELLDRAIALDSTFAMAYRKKAMWLSNQGQPAARVEALRNAYRYRDRLTPLERHLTVAAYFHGAEENLGGAIAAYEAALEIDPLQPSALNNLPTLYTRRGEYKKALEVSQRGLSTTHFPTHYSNHVSLQIKAGQIEAAESTLVRMAEHFPDATWWRDRVATILALARRDFARADSLGRVMEAPGTDGALYRAAELRYIALAAPGKVADARRMAERIVALAEKHDLLHIGLEAAIDAADLELEVLGDTAAALAHVQRYLERHPLESLDLADRPYHALAHLYARAGEPALAAALIEGYERDVPADARGSFTGESLYRERQARAALAMAEGRARDAVEVLREATRDVSCRHCRYPELGRAYEGAGMPDSALVAYQAYLDPPLVDLDDEDAAYLGQALWRAAELHEARGDARDAAALYTRLAELWRDADPVFQPRVAEARRRAGALLSEG